MSQFQRPDLVDVEERADLVDVAPERTDLVDSPIERTDLVDVRERTDIVDVSLTPQELNRRISERRQGVEVASEMFRERGRRSFQRFNESNLDNSEFSRDPNQSNFILFSKRAAAGKEEGEDQFDTEFRPRFVRAKIDAFAKFSRGESSTMLSDEDIVGSVSEEIFRNVGVREKDLLAQQSARDTLEARGIDLSIGDVGVAEALRTEEDAQRLFLHLPDEIPIGDDPAGLKLIGKFENIRRAVIREAASAIIAPAGIVNPEEIAIVQRQLQQDLASNPDLQTSLLFNELPGALGSTAPIIASGGILAIPVGAAIGAGQGRIEAQQAGADGMAQFLNALGNGVIGASEALLFRGAGSASAAVAKRNFKKLAFAMFEGFTVEALQETGQQFSSNVLAKLLFDYERDITEGLDQAFISGGIIGAGFAGASASAQAAREAAAFVQTKIDNKLPLTQEDLNGIIDSIVNPLQEPQDAITSRQETQDVSQVQPQQEQVQAPIEVTEAQVSQVEEVAPVEVQEGAQPLEAPKQPSPALITQKPRRKPKLVRKALKPVKKPKKKVLNTTRGRVEEDTSVDTKVDEQGRVTTTPIQAKKQHVELIRESMTGKGAHSREKVILAQREKVAKDKGFHEQAAANATAELVLSNPDLIIQQDSLDGMKIRLGQVITEHSRTTEKMEQSKSEKERRSAAVELGRLETEISRLGLAVPKQGNLAGIRLQSFADVIVSDLSDAASIARAVAKKGGTLTPVQKQRIKKKATKARKKNEEVKQKQEVADTARAERAFRDRRRRGRSRPDIIRGAKARAKRIKELRTAGC